VDRSDLSDLGPETSSPRQRSRGGRGGETRDERRGQQRRLAWALSLLLPASVLPFASVHVEARLPLAGFGALLGMVAILLGGGHRGQAPGARMVLVLGTAALALAGIAFLPVSAGLRSILHPGVAEASNAVLALIGGQERARVLALDPSRGLVEWATFGSALLVCAGTALVVRNRVRARRLGAIVLATAVGTTLLHLAQRWTDAATILWVSELPRTAGQAFVGTFINPNHAGVLIAAAAPLALVFGLDRGAWSRLLGGLGGLIVLVGAFASGSRGAPFLLLLGLAAWLALSGGRIVRLAVAASLALGLAGAAVFGLGELATWMTGSLDPAQQQAIAGGYQDVWSGRRQLYADVWSMLTVAPLTGVGPGGFDDAWRVLRTGTGFTVADHAHQELLQAVIEHGPLAVLLGLAALGLVLRRALDPDPSGGRGQARLQAAFAAALLVLLVAGLYEFPLRAGGLSTLAALSAGAVLGLAAPTATAPARARHALPALVLVLGAVVLASGARVAGRSVFADPDVAVLRGRAALERAGIERAEGWTVGGDPAALELAADSFEAALWSRPIHRIALQELARVRFRQGRADEAVAILQVATRIYPSLPWTWRDLARVQRVLGQEDLALQAWASSLSADLPARFPVEDFIAEALQSPYGAEVAALAALPPRADRWDTAARVMEEQGDRAQAEVLFREAAALDVRSRAPLALALARWGRFEDVVALLPEPLPVCGEHRALGEALRRLERCEEAQPWAERALTSCGAMDRDARLLVARVRLCRGDERAIAILQALIAERPEEAGPRRSLAQELARRGRTEDARKHLQTLERQGRATEEDKALLASLQP